MELPEPRPAHLIRDPTFEEAAAALGVTTEQLHALLLEHLRVGGHQEKGHGAGSEEAQRDVEPLARCEWDRLLSPAQVGKLFGVRAKTVSTWAVRGNLPFVLTPGGHRRFWESDVRQLLEANAPDQSGLR